MRTASLTQSEMLLAKIELLIVNVPLSLQIWFFIYLLIYKSGAKEILFAPLLLLMNDYSPMPMVCAR